MHGQRPGIDQQPERRIGIGVSVRSTRRIAALTSAGRGTARRHARSPALAREVPPVLVWAHQPTSGGLSRQHAQLAQDANVVVDGAVLDDILRHAERLTAEIDLRQLRRVVELRQPPRDGTLPAAESLRNRRKSSATSSGQTSRRYSSIRRPGRANGTTDPGSAGSVHATAVAACAMIPFSEIETPVTRGMHVRPATRRMDPSTKETKKPHQGRSVNEGSSAWQNSAGRVAGVGPAPLVLVLYRSE